MGANNDWMADTAFGPLAVVWTLLVYGK